MSSENKAMLYIKRFFIYIIVPMTFYPLYFLIANGLDSLIGEQSLLYWLKFESRTQLIEIFINDWLVSLLVMFGVLYGLIVPVELLSMKVDNNCALITAIGCVTVVAFISYLINFRGVELLANSLVMLACASLYLGLKKLLLGKVREA